MELLKDNLINFYLNLTIKMLRGTSIKRIGYELGEQLTSFDPLTVKQNLESLLEGMVVSVDQVTTLGFKKALQEYSVEYRGHNSEYLPVPRTHSEIVGVLCRDLIDNSLPVPPEPPEPPVNYRNKIDRKGVKFSKYID